LLASADLTLVVPAQGLANPTAVGSARLVPGYARFFGGADTTTALEQCVAEQYFVRGGMTRTLLYSQARLPPLQSKWYCYHRNSSIGHLIMPASKAQVSFSGQAVVFVVRTIKWSPMAVAGRLTYIAFFAAQVCYASVVPCTAWHGR